MYNEDRHVLDLLYGRPPSEDGFPIDDLTISARFEAAGAIEEWGFVACLKGRVIAEDRTLEGLCIKARKALER